MSHFWIIEVNGNPAIWAWRPHATSRGGLDIQAYRSRKEAAADLYEAKRLYGKARLTKYVQAEVTS